MNRDFEKVPMPGPGDKPTLTTVCPNRAGVAIEDFFNGYDVDAALADCNALLFRGFGIEDDEQFSAIVGRLARDQLHYTERSTKRTKTAGNVYTSTEYPASKHIASHSENSFQATVPGKILFFAKTPSQSGGETPIASNTNILEWLPEAVLHELQHRGIEYVRNFDGGFDLSWQEAFQTESRTEVEAYCAQHAIEYEWRSERHLRTSQIRPATRFHPMTGSEVWFNQMHLFHSSNLEPAMREALIATVGLDGLPRNARFGDGEEISDDIVDAVRATIRAAETVFPWHLGDLLIADNLLVSHGRRPFAGPREIRVALVDPIEF